MQMLLQEEQLYKFGKYVRVGFVDAVEQDSVIYVLGNEFVDVATKDLKMDDVKAALKAKTDLFYQHENYC